MSVEGLPLEYAAEVLEGTGATRVVLVAHSMGVLVSRAYIADGANADKVSLAISMDGAVTVDGKVAREVKLKSKPPRTKARLRKKRGAVLLKLTVRAANGLGVTYYQIGSEAAVRYQKPVQLTADQVAQLSYASVDAFGNVEPWRRAKKPR